MPKVIANKESFTNIKENLSNDDDDTKYEPSTQINIPTEDTSYKDTSNEDDSVETEGIGPIDFKTVFTRLDKTVNSKISSLILFLLIGIISTFVFCVFGANILWFLHRQLEKEFHSNPYYLPYLEANTKLQKIYYTWDIGERPWDENEPFPNTWQIFLIYMGRLFKFIEKLYYTFAIKMDEMLDGKLVEQQGGGDTVNSNPLKCPASTIEPTTASFPYNMLKENWLFNSTDTKTYKVDNETDAIIEASVLQTIINNYVITLIKTNSGVNGILQSIFQGLGNICKMGEGGVAVLFFLSIPIFVSILVLVAIGTFIGFELTVSPPPCCSTNLPSSISSIFIANV